MATFPIEIAALLEQGFDPAPGVLTGKLYSKSAAGVTQLFYRADDGTVYQLSPPTPGPVGPVGPAGAGAIIIAGADNIGNSADTRYLPFGLLVVGTAPTATIEMTLPRSGTLRNLTVRFNVAPGGANANTISYRARINGVDTALVVNRAANAGVGQTLNTVNTVAVVQGDRLALVAVKAAVVGSGAQDVVVSVEVA